jgi:hypothetical protein
MMVGRRYSMAAARITTRRPLALLIGALVLSQAQLAQPQTHPFAYVLPELSVGGEPSILEECGRDYSAFRILEYADNRPVWIIRAERIGERQRISLRTHQRTQYSAKSNTTLTGLTQDQWAVLLETFSKTGFWELETDLSQPKPDGPTWLIEGCANGVFHYLQLYPARDLRMKSAWEYLSTLVPKRRVWPSSNVVRE